MSANAEKVVPFFNYAVNEGEQFDIHDSLPFDGRSLRVNVLETGIRITEELDGMKEAIFISFVELGTLGYKLSVK